MIGIFALDPGTTSGIDIGFWRVNCPVIEAMCAYEGICDDLAGPIEYQARKLSELYQEFLEVNSPVDHYLVIEKYVQRPTPHFVADESLDPIKVAYMTLGYLSAVFGRDMTVFWQMPSEAMTHATNARLRDWGAWVRGKEHGRDARRHALAFRHAIDPGSAYEWPND